MITFGRAYKVGDKTFGTLDDAKRHAIVDLLGCTDQLAGDVVLNGAEIINILTTRDTSLPRARKANGGTKRRSSQRPTGLDAQGEGTTIRGAA